MYMTLYMYIYCTSARVCACACACLHEQKQRANRACNIPHGTCTWHHDNVVGSIHAHVFGSNDENLHTLCTFRRWVNDNSGGSW